jgi:hypothetical protein
MGEETFEILQTGLLRGGIRGYRGEPDLFCWDARKRIWFFAEAKGKGDSLKPEQIEWIEIYQRVLRNAPNVRIYRVLVSE